MYGSDANFLIFTNVMILAPAIVYVVLVAPFVEGLGGIIFQVAGVFLTILALVYLWRAALLDPGIIPAQPCYIKAEPPTDGEVGLYG